MLMVPMLRDGRPVGAIAVTRADPGFFTENQVALVRTLWKGARPNALADRDYNMHVPKPVTLAN